ncbi:MAG: hypothetical protein OJJ21_00275 [Ferrovibrio sp.]|uniref:hypothetical protein n=1 Tax=Ferrovibrio sp. TaxID=1917215 RepID=UPI0026231B34|nr:hypothetical protein [Ferrovibrio sp.]MCW0232014.1 hypothetical protein [Ferrovibrio sp.]
MDLDQGLFAEHDSDCGHSDCGHDAAFSHAASFGGGLADDPIIDVEAEDIEPAADPRAGASQPLSRLPRIGDRFNTETRFQGQSLSQLAVHSLWIADYLRQLGETEMADGDLDSIGRCADDLESAIMLMFQLAGGTRQELRQRYHEIKLAMRAQSRTTIDLSCAQ